MKPTPLRAERALLHPLWVLSLVLLLINDHALKGAGVLPRAVTGKLSDLAGYFLFPMLLATLLRARSRVGVAAAHALTVGLLLLLELSPAAGALVERWAGIRSWADPTDLVALGSIAASWWVLVPVAEREVPLRLLAARSLAVVGGLASVATSPVSPPPSSTPQPVQGFLWNTTSSDIEVRVMAPRQDLVFSCIGPQGTPDASVYRADQFRVVRDVIVVANGRISLDGFAHGSCNLLLLAVEGAPDTVVIWRSDTLPLTDISQTPEPLAGVQIRQTAFARTIVLPGSYAGGAVPTVEPNEESQCLPPAAFEDPAWSEPVPAGDVQWQLASVSRGIDGCDALSLQPVGGGQPRTFYLCINPLPLPFAVGDLLSFRRPQGVRDGVVLDSGAAIAAAVVTSRPGVERQICAAISHGCVVGAQTFISVSTPNATFNALRAGGLKESVSNGWRTTIHVSRAESVFVARQDCDASANLGTYSSYAWVARKEMP